jgi:MYXO-CTERM domain-containing protein
MRALLLIVALVATSAEATWRSAGIAGTPRDVVATDAGVSVVATTGGAGALTFLATADGGAPIPVQSLAGNYMSALLRGPCLMGLTPQPNASIVFDANCANDNYAYNINSGRLRSPSTGSVYSYTWNGGAQALKLERLALASPTGLASWSALTVSGAFASPFAPLSAVTVAGNEWIATASSATGLLLFRDSISQGTLPAGMVRDVSLFNLDGKPAGAVVTDGGQLLISEDLTAVDGGFFLVPTQAPFTSVSFGAWGSSLFGKGFGMATAGGQIFSPVPNPNAIGQQWVARDAGGVPSGLVRISCLDPAFCTGIGGVGGQNLWFYFNTAAPSSDLRAAVVPVGGTATYVLDAGDPDGDPIWVTWTGGGFSWDGGDPHTITVIGPAATGTCGAPPAVAPLVAMLSDGLSSHDTQITIPVTATSTGATMPALMAMPQSLDFTAGGMAQTVTASFPPDSGCTLPPLTWAVVPDGGVFTLVPNATGVSVKPPTFYCRPTHGAFTLTGGSGDASVSLPVTLAPWGNPSSPVFAPRTVTQRSGTDASYAPDASSAHPCQVEVGFPGTSLVWLVDGGVPGVTVVTGSNDFTVYSTNACVGGTVSAQAKRRVVGLPSQESDMSSGIEVQLVPDWTPITNATAFDAGFSYDNAMSQLVGDFSTGANCASDRDLRAEVIVLGSDGGAVNSAAGIAVPGPWALPVPGGCTGGSFLATASLIDDAGVRYGRVALYPFEAGRIAARVPALKTTEVSVTCSEGARGQLELEVLPTDCALQQFSWVQDRGPALVAGPDGGAIVSFATATHDLQAQAGQELSWSITANIGEGNSQTASRSVRLVPAPFIEIAHRTDVPIAREEEAVGIEVILTNPTACAVSGLLLRESLGRLDPIPGSVRVGGVKVTETIVDDVLEVRELSLPALGSTRVTYLAKVPLLAAARPRGQVIMTGTDVTITAPPPGATGCGCDAASGSGFALLALGAALVRSRRRSV